MQGLSTYISHKNEKESTKINILTKSDNTKCTAIRNYTKGNNGEMQISYCDSPFYYFQYSK